MKGPKVVLDIVGTLAGSIWLTLATMVLLATMAVLVGLRYELSLAGSIGLYFVVWWTMLFAILPVRITSQAEAGEVSDGTDPSAPASPALRERAIWTTIVADLTFMAVAIFFPLAGL